MNRRFIIDLSQRAPRQILADKGRFLGIALILWFRLLRPASVGAAWAIIALYAYRNLLPFDQGDMWWRELAHYAAAIGAIAVGLMTWMILVRLARPLRSRSRMRRLSRHEAGIMVGPVPFAEPAVREWDTAARVLVAAHDANGLMEALYVLSMALHLSADEIMVPGMPAIAYRVPMTYYRGGSRPWLDSRDAASASEAG
ncbi:Biofilm PGA synthesis auxiliary protein PgaD [Burkholderia gladioli]|uniref:Biofilm PGA synthesis auxiliary protein PgaD n=1 Tax=Burkholderia gladioli TaxID=28095 RepID=UPI00164112D5|nr:Biofilm PGA synthesis auxiliary protein PgaD [Burkholderia gladioli]